jgi:hypothetical protein
MGIVVGPTALFRSGPCRTLWQHWVPTTGGAARAECVAVARFNQVDEPSVVDIFEARRKAWINLVDNLPATAFSNKRLVARHDIEPIGHLAEHKI